MDVYNLKQHIIHNSELIEVILENVGFCRIRDLGNEIRCARDEGRNPTSIKINKSTLSTVCFSTNIKGDIITLVQEKLNMTFPETLKLIGKIINFDFNDSDLQVQLPFGGYYKKIGVNKEHNAKMKTYSEDILRQYENRSNIMFYEDGILPQIQEKYEIGYDAVSGRITIPHRNEIGDLVGVMGRVNKRIIEEGVPKYLPIIPFSKSKTVYGYDKNYKNIQEKKIAIICEAEKSVMRLDSMGINLGLAIGGSNISDIQSNSIKALMCDKVIIAFDEGLDYNLVYEQAKKIKMDNVFIKNKVGFIWDKSNEVLKKGSKLAPMDLEKSQLKSLIKNHTVWI